MARRNRKKKKVDGYLVPVPFAGVVILASALALGYVWLGCQCESMGEEIKALETTQSQLGKRYLNAEYRWVRTKSPRSLEIALQRYGISMDWPQVGQVVQIDGPVPAGTDAELRNGIRVAQVSRTMLHE